MMDTEKPAFGNTGNNKGPDCVPATLNKDTSVCFTGHRFISEADLKALRPFLRKTIRSLYEAGYKNFYCGCALGFDTEAGEAVLSLREVCPEIRLIAAVPCADQASRWKSEDQARWQKLTAAADILHVMSPAYYEGCMLARNMYMVDRSSVCVCWMKNLTGGTLTTVKYALREKLSVTNLAMELSSVKKQAGLNSDEPQL